MSANPFQFNKPVRPENFVGRHAIVERIADEMTRYHGDAYAVIGGRRFGKGSLLLALEDRLREMAIRTGNLALLTLPIFISLKSIEPTSLNDVFGLAVHRVKQATSGRSKPAPMFREPLLDLGLPEYTAINPLPASLYDLEAYITESVTAVYAKGYTLQLALLIDEMDYVLDFPWTATLFGMLRSLIYDGPVSDFVRLVIAGTGRCFDVREKGSPLFNAMKVCCLEPFSEDAVRELVNRAIGIPADVASQVMLMGGGHPFILQHLLYYLVESNVASATLDSVDAEGRHFVHDRSADLEEWWHAIGPAGRRAYSILAKSGNWMTHAELTQAASQLEAQLDRGLSALCYQGIAIHDGTYQKYRISGELFREWSRARCASLDRQVDTIAIERETSFQITLDPAKAAKLRPIADVLKDRFDREEFRTLCFNIGANYDLLTPGGLEAQAIQLILSCDRASQLDTLLAEIRRLRPGSI